MTNQTITTSSSTSTSSACLNITIIDDKILEPSQIFMVVFSSSDGNVMFHDNSSVVTVMDNGDSE